MPRYPSSTALSRYKTAQSDVMADLCNIYRVTRATGTYSDDDVTLTTGTYQAHCGFYFTNGQIRVDGQVLLVDYDVVLRLPLTTPVFLTDQIVLSKKGTTFVSGTFLPTEEPEFGPTAQTVHLKRTT